MFHGGDSGTTVIALAAHYYVQFRSRKPLSENQDIITTQKRPQSHKRHRTAVSESIALCCGVVIFLHHNVHLTRRSTKLRLIDGPPAHARCVTPQESNAVLLKQRLLQQAHGDDTKSLQPHLAAMYMPASFVYIPCSFICAFRNASPTASCGSASNANLASRTVELRLCCSKAMPQLSINAEGDFQWSQHISAPA